MLSAGCEVAQKLLEATPSYSLTAVVDRCSCPPHDDLDSGEPACATLRKVGHAVQTEVVLLSELGVPGGEHADALADASSKLGDSTSSMSSRTSMPEASGVIFSLETTMA